MDNISATTFQEPEISLNAKKEIFNSILDYDYGLPTTKNGKCLVFKTL